MKKFETQLPKVRYTLRNQHKIEQYFDKEILKRILNSLKIEFESSIKNSIQEEEPKGKYPLLLVNDIGHTCGFIAFYIIEVDTKFNIYRLAFKEFIN